MSEKLGLEMYQSKYITFLYLSNVRFDLFLQQILLIMTNKFDHYTNSFMIMRFVLYCYFSRIVCLIPPLNTLNTMNI